MPADLVFMMGKFAARQIQRSLAGQGREAFTYVNKGTLATIGRSKAVGDLGKLHISGLFAWLAWLFVHLLFLIGFRNRFMVMMEWAWAYITYNHSARLITGPASEESVAQHDHGFEAVSPGALELPEKQNPRASA